MSVETVFNEFKNTCTNAKKSITLVRDISYLQDEQHRQIRELVISQAFVNVFTGWEHFVEYSMIEYAIGGESKNGNKPICYICPRDSEHASDLIKGSALYPDWSKPEVVKKIAETIFETGEPYISSINGIRSKLNDIKKVRNVLVHKSINSQNEFDKLVRTALKASDVGITPIDFLLSSKNNDPAFYEIYITYLQNAAEKIYNF